MNSFKRMQILLCLFGQANAEFSLDTDKRTLAPFGVDPAHVTVAGYANGAFMAAQLHTIYSSIFQGAALISGGAYTSGQYFDDIKGASKLSEEKQDEIETKYVDKLTAFVKEQEAAQNIDPVSNLDGKPVYIMGCEYDDVIDPVNQNILKKYYESVAVDAKIKLEWMCHQNSYYPHQYIKDWVPFKQLEWLYVSLQSNVKIFNWHSVEGSDQEQHKQNSEFIEFDQDEIIEEVIKDMVNENEGPELNVEELKDRKNHQLLKFGFIQYPHICVNQLIPIKCSFQLVLHGCGGQAHSQMADNWNNHVIKNNIIAVYPQANSCWDTGTISDTGSIGQNTPNHFNRKGIQNRFMKKIIDRVVSDVNVDYNYKGLSRSWTPDEWNDKYKFLPEVKVRDEELGETYDEESKLIWIILGSFTFLNAFLGLLGYKCYKEQLGDSIIWNKQHPVESYRMYLRILWNVIIWYELLYAYKIGCYDDDFDFDNRWWEPKVVVWIAAVFVVLANIVEKCCFHGSRLVVLLGGISWWIHFIIFNQKINSIWVPIINNTILNLKHMYWFTMWAKYGESDMSSFKTHGSFRPGMKRFTSEEGNDCMAFYPVDISIKPSEIKAYRSPWKQLMNFFKSGLPAMGQRSKFFHRKVNGLVEDGPMQQLFVNKQKKLIPILFCHGMFSNSEEYYGICMQLASYGYLVIVPDFKDGTAMCATDIDGKNIPLSMPKGKQKNKNGSTNMEWQEQLKPKLEQRVQECHALGKEIKSKGFAINVLTFDVNIDSDKMIIGGHSFGGWTAILAAEGRQDIFKVCLAFDPYHIPHMKEINEDSFTMRVPTCIVNSSTFYSGWCASVGYKKGQTDQNMYLRRFADTMVNPDKNLVAIEVADSMHLDFTDTVLHSQFETMIINQGFKVSKVKNQGTNIEFHEFLPMLWLDYLLIIGQHNNTFTQSGLQKKMNQFNKLINFIQVGQGPNSSNRYQYSQTKAQKSEQFILNSSRHDTSAIYTQHQNDVSQLGLLDQDQEKGSQMTTITKPSSSLSKTKPAMKFEYFGLHGRGLQVRMILNYVQNCKFEDVHVTQEEHAKRTATGELKYGQLPCLTIGNMQMVQSNAIARFIGKSYKGLQGEELYPSNNNPKLMHKIDELLEISTSMLSAYSPFMIPFFPSYKERDTLIPKWLNETLPKYLLQIEALKRKNSVYLCTDYITIGDLVIFSHFWRFCYNPVGDKDLEAKTLAVLVKHDTINQWVIQMNKDLQQPVISKLFKSPF